MQAVHLPSPRIVTSELCVSQFDPRLPRLRHLGVPFWQPRLYEDTKVSNEYAGHQPSDSTAE